MVPPAGVVPPAGAPVHGCADPADRARGLRLACSALRRGDLVVLPTDTVYGVGADAFSAAGTDRLRRARGRGRDLPLPVLVGWPRTMEGLATDLSAAARDLAEGFWPGPLTLVARQQPSLAWDIGGAGGAAGDPASGATVALRMPLHPVALELLREVGPLAVTAANRAGRPVPTSCRQAAEQLGADVSVYLDAGPTRSAQPSTVVDVTGPVPVLLRAGALGADALREACPALLVPGGLVPGEGGPGA